MLRCRSSTDEDTLDVREVSLIQDEDGKFAEDSVEKEFSSLGLDLSVREESVEVDEESVEEEEEVIEGEKELPSLGLDLSVRRSQWRLMRNLLRRKK